MENCEWKIELNALATETWVCRLNWSESDRPPNPAKKRCDRPPIWYDRPINRNTNMRSPQSRGTASEKWRLIGKSNWRRAPARWETKKRVRSPVMKNAAADGLASPCKHRFIYWQVGENYVNFGDRVGWPVHQPHKSHRGLRFNLKAPPGHLPSRIWVGGIKPWNHAEAMVAKLTKCGII